MIRSSSLGTMCHRDEYLFIRYKDGYQIMTDRGRVKSEKSMMTTKGKMKMISKSMG